MIDQSRTSQKPDISSDNCIAHFLLTPNLALSPPNDALNRACAKLGYRLEMFSPGPLPPDGSLQPVGYGYRWLLKNLLNPRWRKYAAFSCTSEDPVVIAGLLAVLWRKPLIFISDEIKSGAYRGDRSDLWKKLCRWCMRRAAVTIVNDESRIDLQRSYADLSPQQTVQVYPGCFLHPPVAADRQALHSTWEIPEGQSVLCFSGGCNLSAGIDWALESLDDHQRLNMVTQPLTVGDLNRYLLKNHRHADRIHVQSTPMSWQESWASMGGVDIGIAVYTNPADQFQLMGISSNRLCMFLAMGIPVIVSRQPSFQFVEDYNCGFMVENASEFSAAVGKILADNERMKENALRCTAEYIDTDGKHQMLRQSLAQVLTA